MLGALLFSLVAQQSDDFGKTWDQVASAIRKQYYAREVRSNDMDRLLAQFAPRATAAKSRQEFGSIVEEMIRAFNDSHFDFYTHSDQGYYLMASLSNFDGAEGMPNIGAWFVGSNQGYKISMVLDGGESAKVGLRKGDVVRTIDGEPFSPVDSLASRVGKIAQLEILRSGSSLKVGVRVTSESCLNMFLDATKASVRIIPDQGRKIGYIHLWTQANDRFRNALSEAVYGKLRSTDGFILDLRDGFGGRPEGYGDPFFRPEFWIDWDSTPRTGFQQLYGYQRPLAVLINGGSRSAKEILSYAFKASHRGQLIGQTTAGNVLGTFPLKINDWAFLEIPTVDVIVQGTRLEKNGVVPDVPVPSELGGNGEDFDMQAALQRLARVKIYQGQPKLGNGDKKTAASL